MFFFFRKPKVIVDCFIDSKIMAEAYAIRRGIKCTPEWWQKLTPTCPVSISGVTEQIPTAKKCSGFMSLYKESWMVPMWSDVTLHTSSEGQFKYKFATGADWATMFTHPPSQFTGGFPDKIHFKINCPWHLAEKTGVNFVFMPAYWSLIDLFPGLGFLPGVINFSTNHSIHVNILASKVNARYDFAAGTPLVHLIPISDKEVVFKTHAITEQELTQMEKDYHPRFLNKFF